MEEDRQSVRSTVSRDGLSVMESYSPKFRDRTVENARWADFTVAFAVDFTSPGEKLTATAAGENYLPFDLPHDGEGLEDEARRQRVATILARRLESRTDPVRLNVAGSTASDLSRHGISQEQADAFITDVLGRWAFPGGFLNMDEDAITGAKRELKEETGLEDAFIEQFHTFSEVGREPRGRVITIAHYALVRTQEVKGGDDAAQARWFSIPEVPPLAFDHDRILRLALARLREKIHFAPVGFELLPDEFTMPQLQNLYESILEVRFDRRNFSSKMLKLGILDCVSGDNRSGEHRRPLLYRFNKERYDEMKSKGFRLEF